MPSKYWTVSFSQQITHQQQKQAYFQEPQTIGVLLPFYGHFDGPPKMLTVKVLFYKEKHPINVKYALLITKMRRISQLSISCNQDFDSAIMEIRRKLAPDNQVQKVTYFSSMNFESVSASNIIIRELSTATFMPCLKVVSLLFWIFSESSPFELLQRFSHLRRMLENLCGSCDEVEQIELQDICFTDGLLRLVADAQWKYLKVAHFSKSSISSEGVRYFSSFCFAELKRVSFSGNLLKNVGIKWLMRADWPALQSLNIIQVKLTRDFLRMIPKFSSRNLASIDMQQTNLVIRTEVLRYEAVVLSHQERRDWKGEFIGTLSKRGNLFRATKRIRIRGPWIRSTCRAVLAELYKSKYN